MRPSSRLSVTSVFIFVCLLAACQPAAALTPTPTPSPSLTPPPQPTAMPSPALAPPARCPPLDPLAAMSLTTGVPVTDKALLAYLNAGGAVSRLQALLDAWNAQDYQQGGRASEADLTGDGVAEILVDVFQEQQKMPRRLYIFGCEAGAYKTLASFEAQSAGQGYEYPIVADMNWDGVPEMVMGYRSGHSPNLYLSVFIFEWDGSDFKNLMPQSTPLANGEYTLKDLAGDGRLELIVSGSPAIGPEESAALAGRQRVETWAWNGQQFVLTSVKTGYTAPVYRFQAARLGDEAIRSGELSDALAFYYQVITDETLAGWNPAWATQATGGAEPPTGTPAPPPDPAERARLEAYARYRIVLLYLIEGYSREAQVEYDLLQAEVAAGSPGAPYARMATVFWQEYNIRQSLSAACAQAADYARAHADEILTPLGSRYYGEGNGDYAPEDICPF